MTNEEKIKKIVQWVDPEERVTVHFLDEKDLHATDVGAGKAHGSVARSGTLYPESGTATEASPADACRQ